MSTSTTIAKANCAYHKHTHLIQLFSKINHYSKESNTQVLETDNTEGKIMLLLLQCHHGCPLKLV